MQSVCVFGASRAELAEKYFVAAHRLGVLLAENGLTMVFGAGDAGLMGAAARGVQEGGGRIVGVIPEKLNQPGIAFPACSELIITKTMHERKAKMEALSDGFVALPGGFGTLEEILEVIALKQLAYMDAPIVLLDQDGFYSRLLDQMRHCINENFTDAAFASLYCAVSTPEDAIRALLAYQPARLPDKIRDVLSHK